MSAGADRALASDPEAALEFADVYKTFRGARRPVLEDASLRVASGEWLFLVGRSGAGKSTVLRTFYKAVRPERGRVRVLGMDLSKVAAYRVRQRMGLVFQSFELLPQKTAFENVAYGAEILGMPPHEARERAGRMLESVGLADAGDRFPHQLSGGEQQRVGLARALIHRPPVILADEPTGNLDVDAARAIHGIFERVHADWAPAIVIATHSRDLLDWAGRRVVRIEHGALLEEAPGGPRMRDRAPRPAVRTREGEAEP